MLKQSGLISPHRTDTSHVAQLFDSDDSLADGVASFLREGLMRNGQVLAVVSEVRWYAISMRLSALGWPTDEAVRLGHLVVRNATQTLDEFMIDGRLRTGLFFATVGTLVEGLTACRKPLRIYGEMVDLLAARGDYAAALELEDLWNELASEHRFTLLCGYTAGYFGDPRNAKDLRRICDAHSAVRSHPEDVLGPFLVARHYTA
jgi:hypothetical protein